MLLIKNRGSVTSAVMDVRLNPETCVMPTAAVKRLACVAPTIGAVYYFAGGVNEERFKGVVREKVPIDDTHVTVKLEMTAGEHERLLMANR
jgi:hypothetical protein